MAAGPPTSTVEYPMPMQTHAITIITAGHSDVRPRAAQEQAEQTTRGQQALEE